MKTNHLRKVYLIYWVTIGELFCIAFVISSAYILQEPLKTILTAMGFIGIGLIPVVTFFFYKWLKKDNATSSDELERLVLRKAFAVTGFCAMSTLPALMLLVCLLPGAGGYCVFGYTFLIGATFKISTVYYHQKF